MSAVGSDHAAPAPAPAPGGRAGERPWPHVSLVRRTGPAVLVVIALVAAGLVATVNRSSTPAGSGAAANGAAGVHGVALTYAKAKAEGRTADYQWSAGCDTTTGRLRLPMAGGFPCIAQQAGSNGGATWSGVTATTITVALYEPAPGGLTTALAGATDPPAAVRATAEAFVAMLNAIVPLHGRKVVLVPYQATGGSSDAVAGRADAITVGQSLHAFASIGGPQQTSAYEDELARLHVLCVGCGLSVPYAGYQQEAPYLWGDSPTPDTLLTDALDFVVADLVGKDATHAGEAAFRREKRRFALVHYDQNPPLYGGLTKQLDKEFAATKLRLVDNESYLLDLPQLPSEAATIAAHLKATGATTVIFAGDPIMPIYLTQAAAAIGYFPEWVITGTVLTDTSTLGRLYDQQEWAHAFGISTLPVPTPAAQSIGRSLYRWYYGTEPAAIKTASLILTPILLLYTGLELAGPHLTPDSFRAGMFEYPPSGGSPTNPRVAYGSQGAPPVPAYTTPADYTVIWWDANAVGPDEQGAVGHGLFRYVDGGRRYPAGTKPPANLPLFSKAGTVTSYTSASAPGEHVPKAPPWPGSPAALKAGSSTGAGSAAGTAG